VTAVIRHATPEDLDAIVTLCAEHAALERASFCAERARAALGAFLFAERPRAWCLVVEANGMLIGYATYSLEFSTWRASEFAHMDCLYLKEGYRNAGVGRELILRVRAAAGQLGCELVEWQTPSWNSDAVRFYDRLGAIGSSKIRYRWAS
jgi:GNAT superfamily N-acetyltransferase